MSLFLLILGLVLFVGLVVIHEFGHFIMARRNGVEVEEFGIGFPPKLWGKKIKSKKGDYELTFNALPLGGFVRLKGENDSSEGPGSFGAASLKGKIQIMLAGVALNLVTAFVLLTLAALVGIPKLLDNQFTVASDTKVARQDVLVGAVESGSPAEQAGLRVRDKVISLGVSGQEQPVGSAKVFPELTRQYGGQTIQVNYEREGQFQTTSVQLRSQQEVDASKKTDKPKGFLGVVPSEYIIQRSTWSAPVVSVGLIKQFTVETFKGLGSIVAGLSRGDTKKATEQVSGPVGIFVLLKDGSLLGYQFVLVVLAIISLTLAIMNVLPIPALDGGRLFVTLLFRGLKRPLTKTAEDRIHGMGFAVLMVLFLLITIVDVKRFF